MILQCGMNVFIVLFNLNKTLKVLKTILFNTHVQFGPYLFHQKIRIPMGDNCAPFLADHFLSWLE